MQDVATPPVDAAAAPLPAEPATAEPLPPVSIEQRWDDLVTTFNEQWVVWAWAAGRVALAIVLGLIVHWILFAIVKRLVRRTSWTIDDAFIKRLKAPSRLIFPLLGVGIVLPTLGLLSDGMHVFLRHVVSLGTIAAVTWLLVRMVSATERSIKQRHRLDIGDNLEARRVHTQITVLARTLMVFLVILGAAAALMTFPRVREFGASLLVSAGFAGLAIGLAARPVLENLIGGVQLALTQPIRLDDVVIIEGEFGRVEEITTTYVVIRIWDQRRLIVPFSKFISEPFQNWTRTSADLLGTVYLYADYTVPVEEVRQALQRIVEASEKWDRRACGLVVTDATEHTVQLRALVSAANSGDAWDLRVHVREQLLAWLQREHPECLPRTRVEMNGENAQEGAVARG